jgi:TATA-box binding protein (TBP) (component of TFIID and TFIIIB)
MFKALYVNEMNSFSDQEKTDIIKFSEELRATLQEFYKKIKILQHRKNAKYIITVSMETEKKLDLNQIAQKIEGAEFNAEKFPGLVMKSENSSVTIILFSTGKMVITGLKSSTEAEQVVDKAINKIRDIGAKIESRKIAIESVK